MLDQMLAAASVDSSNESSDDNRRGESQLPISEATEAMAAAPPSPPRTPLDDDVEDEDDQDQDQDHEEKQQAHGEQTTDMPSEETPQERGAFAGGGHGRVIVGCWRHGEGTKPTGLGRCEHMKDAALY